MRCTFLARTVSLLSALTVTATSAYGQCPDGSRPPCSARTSAAASRPVNLPLDEHTWIIMPFDNLSNSAEIEWLRNASVNLLYLDMSRWRDIRVVDDERVADLVREAPVVRTPATLSLASALTMARRAGAGKLVMGDVLKSGSRMMLTAKVFDVRNGQRVHTVRAETSVPDSVIALFGRLAQRILKVDPPPGSSVGMIGTSSIEAYQAYSLGVQALNRFDLKVAKENLRRAVRMDSTFALAHYKLATALGWEEGGDPTRPMHAEASARYSTTLPQRERSLIEAQASHIRGEISKARDLYAALVRADSSDVEAWHGLGETTYHDAALERVPGDTTRVRVRGDWNLAVRAFERVLMLDPSYHVAYPHLVDMGLTSARQSCLINSDQERQCVGGIVWVTTVRASGDSLLLVSFRPTPDDSAQLRAHLDEFMRQGGMRRQLLRADAYSQRWANAAPSEFHALGTRARVLALQGRLGEAAAHLGRAGAPESFGAAAAVLALRIDLAMKMTNTKEAHRIYDSVRTAAVQLTLRFGADTTTMTMAQFLARNYGFMFGRFAEGDPVLTTSGMNPVTLRFRRAFARTMAGFADSASAAEHANFERNMQSFGLERSTRALAPALSFSLRAPREGWPAIDTSLKDVRLLPVIALMRHDTAGLRAAARVFDAKSKAMTDALLPDTAYALIAADAHLAAGDSAAALGIVRRMLDSTLATADLGATVSASGTVKYSAALPRVMLLRADLAAALGQRAEAMLWYSKFLDLWATTDAEVQPIVERARAAVATLAR